MHDLTDYEWRLIVTSLRRLRHEAAQQIDPNKHSYPASASAWWCTKFTVEEIDRLLEKLATREEK